MDIVEYEIFHCQKGKAWECLGIFIRWLNHGSISLLLNASPFAVELGASNSINSYTCGHVFAVCEMCIYIYIGENANLVCD